MRLRYTSPLSLPRLPPGSPASALHAAPGACILMEPPGKERPMLRHAPAFIDDPSGTGLFAGLGAQTYVSPPALKAIPPRQVTRARIVLPRLSCIVSKKALTSHV